LTIFPVVWVLISIWVYNLILRGFFFGGSLFSRLFYKFEKREMTHEIDNQYSYYLYVWLLHEKNMYRIA